MCRFGKNFVFIFVGGVHVEAAPWVIAGFPLAGAHVRRFAINAVLYSVLVNVQDIRDTEGALSRLFIGPS